jgi:hypothetical protein
VLRATHAHDLERLAEAKARLKDELAAKAARDAKAEEEAEEAAAEKALQARQLAAAITIQAAWRGYKVGAGLDLNTDCGDRQMGGVLMLRSMLWDSILLPLLHMGCQHSGGRGCQPVGVSP